jgi:hypothetical protein
MGKCTTLANSRARSRALSRVQSVEPAGLLVIQTQASSGHSVKVANGGLANDLNEDKLLRISGLFPLSQLFEAGHHTLPLGSMANHPSFSESPVAPKHQVEVGKAGDSGLVQPVLAELVVKPPLNIGSDGCCAPEV